MGEILTVKGLKGWYTADKPVLKGLDLDIEENSVIGLIGLNGNAFADAYTGRVFLGNIWLFAAAILFSLPIIPKLREKAFRSAGSAYAYQAAGVICNALLLLAGSLMLSSRSYPFIYFNI